MTFSLRSALAQLFSRTRDDQYVERYVLRELGHGRRLDEILDDPYVRNRTVDSERARLLERPEIVAAAARRAPQPRA
jgi:hypothetical protein